MATDTNKLQVINPSSQEVIQEIDKDTLQEAMVKLTFAKRLHLNKSQHLPLHTRIELLEKLTQIMQSKHQLLSELIATEGGKPLADAKVEVTRAIAGVKSAAQYVSENHGNVIPLGNNAASSGHNAHTEHFPRGVVLAFSAFNHPLNLIVHQVIPAFATGCPCVVKPAPDTPLSCIKLVSLMYEAGIPEDYIRTVITDDLDTASAMVESEDIAFFSFIGSAKVGWLLRSKLAPGVRCALEHGGIAPCIVTPNADLEQAINAILKGGFYHAGQVCVSTQRVYVHETIFNELSQILSDKVSKLIVGDAISENTEVGPLIRPGEVDRIDAWVQEAITGGAKCLNGGNTIPNTKGNFYQATLLSEPPIDSKVSQQEVFGPVVCLYSYKEMEEAIKAANDCPFAFQASIFSRDAKEIRQAYEGFEASAVIANNHTAFRDDVMPFAGLKASGLGIGGIGYTIEDMQFEKMLVNKQ